MPIWSKYPKGISQVAPFLISNSRPCYFYQKNFLEKFGWIFIVFMKLSKFYNFYPYRWKTSQNDIPFEKFLFNYDVAYLNRVLNIRIIVSPNLLEEILTKSGYNSRLSIRIVTAHHCIRLASPRLPVSKNANVVSWKT